MWVLITVLLVQNYVSAFSQSFYLHRYAAHGMFKMSHGWERFFHFLTFLSQGSSYLNPRAYAILHRLHHKFADVEGDPHSPHIDKGLINMMYKTLIRYEDIRINTEKYCDGVLDKDTPVWNWLDKFGSNRLVQAAWVIFYIGLYYTFAPNLWWWLLIPVHCMIGPIHGAIVNYCGHIVGYRNYETQDHSRNISFFDFIGMGELYHNNHHRYPNRMNFGSRWHEFDPTYHISKLLFKLGIIKPTEKSGMLK